MRHSEFEIGQEFRCGGRTWRCTDTGTRTIAAIPLDGNRKVTSGGAGDPVVTRMSRAQAEADGWFRGPPYAVAETVFDEDSMVACTRPRRRRTAAD